METYLSNEQRDLVLKIKETLAKAGVPFELKDHNNEGGAFITISSGKIMIYIYDDGEAEIHGPPHDIFFEIYDFKHHAELQERFIQKLIERLQSK